MAERDIIMMKQKELKQLHVIHKVLEGSLTRRQAAEVVSLSERQIRRIVKRIRAEGDKGIQHRSRGKESNRRLPKKLVAKVVQLYQEKYEGFGPTLTAEKLLELDGIEVSKETVRMWLIEAGQWKKGRKRRQYRQWRPRKVHSGEMVQMDGSHHDWFEGRRSKCVLMAYIDDATNRVYGRFYEYEGTIPAFDSFKRYIRRYGIPMSIYFDRHTTYKSPSEPSIEDEINGTEPLSEFGRALKELNVELIHAYSPQAKGRVERLFATLQDRLVKELRLRGISAIEEANKFVDGSYWTDFNKKFMVKAQGKEDIHRRLPKGLNLDKILCIRTERTVRNDNTITHKRKLYQIEEPVKGGKVIIEQHINGKMRLTYDGNSLKFKEIEVRPEKQQKQRIRPKRRKPCIPSAAHPWKKFNIRGFMKRHERQKNVTEAAA